MREKFHVWDLIDGKYLGCGNSFAYGFGPSTQSLFVMLTYKPEKLESTLSGKGRHFTVDFRIKADTKSVCGSYSPDYPAEPGWQYKSLLYAVAFHIRREGEDADSPSAESECCGMETFRNGCDDRYFCRCDSPLTSAENENGVPDGLMTSESCFQAGVFYRKKQYRQKL